MSKITPGQIYARGSEYAFILVVDGDNAQAVLLPSGARMTLDSDALIRWSPWKPMNADGWYVERVGAGDKLLWGAFLPDYATAWALFVAAKVDEGDGPGRVRVGGALDATIHERMAFDDAFGYGPEPFISLDAAVLATGQKEDRP